MRGDPDRRRRFWFTGPPPPGVVFVRSVESTTGNAADTPFFLTVTRP